jgi:DeoR/GlpR family transcriptional regulator of sugar metabolism
VYNRYVGASRNEDLLYELLCLSDKGIIEDSRSITKELMAKMDISHVHLRQLLMQLEKLGVIKKYRGMIILDPALVESKDDKIDMVEIIQRKPKDGKV